MYVRAVVVDKEMHDSVPCRCDQRDAPTAVPTVVIAWLNDAFCVNFTSYHQSYQDDNCISIIRDLM